MTFEEFVNQYSSLAINNIPNEDYDFIRTLYPKIFGEIPKNKRSSRQNTRYEYGFLVSHLFLPYYAGDEFRHRVIFEWREIRGTLSDFSSECNFDIDVMSVL